MERLEALKLGYCKYCAAYGLKGWNCGVTKPESVKKCILPADVCERFKAERGLEGETKRLETGDFGDRSLMKKPPVRRKKRR
jgi:hypothetical protein